YACAPSFEAAMKKYGADYEMIVGKGMFHCYPVFPICREAREGWKLMIRRMREESNTMRNGQWQEKIQKTRKNP
ncbi:MAG: hypothetical protein ABS897_11855, partial [Eubacteriales bacterium]